MPILTHAPLPTGRNLVAALLNPRLTDIELAAPWCRSGDQSFWFSRSAWSLLAIAKWRQRVMGKTSITVWLPDFFCNSSLAPLRTMGAQLQFYPINLKMEPDIEVCRAMTNEPHPDLFVLVHFFGQPTPAADASMFCRETGAWLIEDAAHVLRPVAGIGEFGDCVLYSPHKHLPIPDGAVMVVRKTGPGQLTNQSTAFSAFQDVSCSLLNTPGFSHHLSGLWLAKRVLQRMGVRAWHRSITPFLIDAEPFSSRREHPKMSLLARHLLSGLIDSLNTVVDLRRQNRLLWNQVLARANPSQAEIWPVAGECTPYLAGFTFDEEALAEEVFLRCQRAGLPVTTWPDLPPEVSVQKDCYRNALLLRKTRIYLPVHQSLDHSQITDCAGIFQ